MYNGVSCDYARCYIPTKWIRSLDRCEAVVEMMPNIAFSGSDENRFVSVLRTLSNRPDMDIAPAVTSQNMEGHQID